MRTRVERSKLRFITRRPWGAWRAIAFGAIARARLRRSARRLLGGARGSRRSALGWAVPKSPVGGPGPSGGPKSPDCVTGTTTNDTVWDPPPQGPILAPPTRRLPALPSRRRNFDFAMNFQWIYTILLFHLVVADRCAYVYLPQSAGAYWQRSFVFSWKFSYAAGGLRFSSDEVLGVQRSVYVFLISLFAIARKVESRIPKPTSGRFDRSFFLGVQRSD